MYKARRKLLKDTRNTSEEIHELREGTCCLIFDPLTAASLLSPYGHGLLRHRNLPSTAMLLALHEHGLPPHHDQLTAATLLACLLWPAVLLHLLLLQSWLCSHDLLSHFSLYLRLHSQLFSCGLLPRCSLLFVASLSAR